MHTPGSLFLKYHIKRRLVVLKDFCAYWHHILHQRKKITIEPRNLQGSHSNCVILLQNSRICIFLGPFVISTTCMQSNKLDTLRRKVRLARPSKNP